MSISVRISSNSGSATLIASENHEEDNVTVKVVTLDEFVENNKVHKVNLIKIDVEGFEANVLTGCKKSISKFTPIFFLEIDPPLLLKANSSVKEIQDTMHANGYKMYCSKRDKLLPFGGLENDETYVNVLCLTNDHLNLLNK